MAAGGISMESAGELRLGVIKALAFHKFNGRDIKTLIRQETGQDKTVMSLNPEECRKILMELGADPYHEQKHGNAIDNFVD